MIARSRILNNCLYLLLSLLPLNVFAADQVVNFNERSNGEIVTTQYSGQGIVFANSGVRVVTDVNNAANKVVEGADAQELYRGPIRINFSATQTVVTVSVRNTRASYNGIITMQLTGYRTIVDIINGKKVTRTEPFINDRVEVVIPNGVFQTLTIESTIAEIEFVTIDTFHSVDQTYNNFYLVVDDLEITGDTPPPPPVDETPPVITVQEPGSGATLTSRFGRLVFSISDTVDLFSVQAKTIHLDSGTEQSYGMLCGNFAQTACSNPFTADRDMRLLDDVDGSALNGDYRLVVEAADSAGNNSVLNRDFVLNEPDPVGTTVKAWRLEVNQGIQDKLIDRIPLPGDFVTGAATLLLPGKDTVVRWYLLSDPVDAPGFNATMNVLVVNADDTTETLTITPNTSLKTVDVPADPGVELRDDFMFWELRPDMARTLNYVIPGSRIQNAKSLQFRLQGTTGDVTVSMASKAVYGVNVLRIVGSATGDTIDMNDFNDKILRYLKNVFPVVDVKVLSVRDFPWLYLSSGNSFDGMCQELLDDIWWAYGWGDTPKTYNGPEPSYVSNIGMATTFQGDCGGMAKVGDPDDDDYRIGSSSISTMRGDVAAQELGHNLGLRHVSKDHGEDGGGRYIPDANHGRIGAFEFGVIPRESTAPSGNDFGEWDVALVDPCEPAASQADRFPCDLKDSNDIELAMHDYMSYGPSQSLPYYGFTTWTSIQTAFRAHSAITTRQISPVQDVRALITNDNDAEQEAWLVSGVIHEDKSVVMYPLRRKPVAARYINQLSQGPMTFEMTDDNGNILVSRAFDETQISSLDFYFQFAVPYTPEATRFTIMEGEQVLFEKAASGNPPQVNLLEPKGGEIYQSGEVKIVWQVDDADGEPVHALIQYSPNGGERWETITMVKSASGDHTSTIDVSQLEQSRTGVIRISATDGFNTPVVESNTVSIGTEQTPLPRKQIADKNRSSGGGSSSVWWLLLFAVWLIRCKITVKRSASLCYQTLNG